MSDTTRQQVHAQRENGIKTESFRLQKGAKIKRHYLINFDLVPSRRAENRFAGGDRFRTRRRIRRIRKLKERRESTQKARISIRKIYKINFIIYERSKSPLTVEAGVRHSYITLSTEQRQ